MLPTARRGAARAGLRGRIFPGVSRDRCAVGQKPAGKVPSLGRVYSPGGRGPDARTEVACPPGAGASGPLVCRPGGTVLSAPRLRACAPRDLPRAAQGLRLFCRHPVRPVLKHGPRSLTCVRATGPYETQRRSESEGTVCPCPGLIPPRGGARPARLRGLRPRGGARVHTLGPERW